MLVAIAFLIASATISTCHPRVSCKSTLDRWSCPAGTFYRENVKSLNHCPACVTLKEKDKPCDGIDDVSCAPGLKCAENPQTEQYSCTTDELQRCEYYKREDRVWTMDQYWQPDCLPDGKFAPKQCKGESPTGRCFCMNDNGVRIFGEQPWEKSENMTCVCSRLVESLKRQGKHVSLHCDEKGNFEELQCDDDVCWCSNHLTGIPFSPVVPESMIRVLPCFNEETFGCQYLRQCDSVSVNCRRALKLLHVHGTIHVAVPISKCNYDGSYGRLQTLGSNNYCVYKNKTKLTNPESRTKNCNCAYDEYVAKIEEKDFNFICDSGAYLKDMVSGNKKFCVDEDGFPYFFEDLDESEIKDE